MTKNEALKMAIEAMERAEEVDWELNSLHVFNILQAIQACKKALEQAKQFSGMKEIPYKDWVLRFYKMPNDLWYTEGINEEWMNEMFEASKPQPAQEPVAYVKDIDNAPFQTIDFAFIDEEGAYPVYTHPAPSWQGLSDDEREILYDKAIEMPLENLWNDYAYLIEQALKDKNS